MGKENIQTNDLFKTNLIRLATAIAGTVIVAKSKHPYILPLQENTHLLEVKPEVLGGVRAWQFNLATSKQGFNNAFFFFLLPYNS